MNSEKWEMIHGDPPMSPIEADLATSIYEVLSEGGGSAASAIVMEDAVTWGLVTVFVDDKVGRAYCHIMRADRTQVVARVRVIE